MSARRKSQWEKEGLSGKLFDVFNIIFITVIVLVTLYPLLYTVFASFSDARALLAFEGALIAPLEPITLQGYELVFKNPNIISGFINTVKLVVLGTLLGVFLTMLGAFVVTRKYFKFRKLMMKLIMVTMFFSGGMVPTYFVVRNLGLINNFWAMILPGAMGTYYLIILRTFFMSIPDSLEESAVLDGAGDLRVLFAIYMPLSTPALAVITLHYAVNYWNSWYSALLYIQDRSLYPLQMFLREVLIQNDTSRQESAAMMVSEAYTRELVKYCTVVISTVPILLFYPFLQKYFVKGMLIGAVKG